MEPSRNSAPGTATKSPLDIEWAGSVWVEFGPSSFEYNFVRYSLNEQDWSGRIL